MESPGLHGAMAGPGVSSEVVDAVDEGWFPAGVPALDVGCGQGEVAAWLSSRGFPTLGVDIAPSAIARAVRQYGERPGTLEFQALDICSESPPDRQYRVLVDRGCLHQIHPADAPSYLRTIVSVSAPDARMLLFVKAFRHDVPLNDASEWRRVSDQVEQAMSPSFEIVRRRQTFLDPFEARVTPARALPGIGFWLVRRPEAAPATADGR